MTRPSLLRRILTLTHPEDRDETRHTLYVIVCQDLNIGREECLMEAILARGDKTMLYSEIAELVRQCPSALLHDLYSKQDYLSLDYLRLSENMLLRTIFLLRWTYSPSNHYRKMGDQHNRAAYHRFSYGSCHIHR